MINPVKLATPVISKTAKSLMLAASLLVGANAYAQSTKPQVNSTTTEAIYPSHEAADASRLYAVNTTTTPAQTAAVPKQHNKKLDDMCLKFAADQEDAAAIKKAVDANYNQYGTYMASIQIQRLIDLNMLDGYTDGDVNKFAPMDIRTMLVLNNTPVRGVKSVKESLMNWYMNVYWNAVGEALSKTISDNKGTPNYKQCSEALDNVVKTKLSNIFNGNNLALYNAAMSDYLTKVKTYDVQAQSNILAYKMFLIDYIVLLENLRSVGVFDDGYKDPNGLTTVDYFDRIVRSVAPDSK